MFSAGYKGDKGIKSAVDFQKSVKQWGKYIEDGASPEKIHEAEKQIAKSLKRRPFLLKQARPFFQKMAQKMARTLNAKKAFRQFSLPGKNRVVVDKRDQQAQAKAEIRDAAKETVKESAKKAEAQEMTLREGKLISKRGKAGDTKSTQQAMLAKGGLEQRAASARVDKLLSAFEKMIVARFEGGKEVAKYTQEGKPAFAEKSESQWKQFFQKFLGRTIKKRMSIANIKDFLFRGMVAKGTKGMVISDMRLSNGRVEKYIRFAVLQDLIARFQKLKPGQKFGKGELAGEELMYLALAAARGKDRAMARKAAEGRFMGAQAEALAAEALGIPLEEQLREKARRMRGKGPFAGFFEKDAEPEELPYRFVPWWQWGNLSRPGKFRWFTLFFYIAMFVLGLIGIVLITMKLLGD